MKKKAIFMTEPQIDKLTAESIRTGLSLSELVRRALDAYLSKVKL